MTQSRKQPAKFQLEANKRKRAPVTVLAWATEQITLTLPVHMWAQIQSKANSCDVGFESLVKCWLHEKLVTLRSAESKRSLRGQGQYFREARYLARFSSQNSSESRTNA